MTEAAVVQSNEPWYADLVRNVATNPTQIEWPRDEHGTTSALKKAITLAAMSVKGNKGKEDVLIATLMVGMAHIRKRVRKDAEVQSGRIAKIRAMAEQRKPLERFT